MQARALPMMRSRKGRGKRAAALCCWHTRFSGMVLLVLAIWLGCCCAGAAKVTSVQVAVWETGIPGEKDCVSDLVRAFQREHPEILICLEWRDAVEAEGWVERWCDGYSDYAPDLAVMTDLWLHQYRKDLLPLGRGLQQDLRGRLVPAVLGRGGELGSVRGVPWTVATAALYYRSDLLRDANMDPPTNFEQLVECAVALANPPARYGFGLPGVGGGAEELLYALAQAAGGDIADAERQIDLTAEPFEQALELLVDLQSRGALQPEVLTWTEVELGELLAQGKLAMMVGRPWLAVMLEDAKKKAEEKAEKEAEEKAQEETEEQAEGEPQREVEYAIASLPCEPGGRGYVAVDWLVAFRNTDRRKQALKLLEFVARERWQRALAVVGGVPPTTGVCAELRSTPRWEAHIRGIDGATGLPFDQWPRLKAQLANALSYALSGRLTVSEALQRAAAIEP